MVLLIIFWCDNIEYHMSRWILLLTFISFAAGKALAQVGIGTDAPSTDLEVTDTTGEAGLTLKSFDGAARLKIESGAPTLDFDTQLGHKGRINWQVDELRLYSSPPDTIYVLGNPLYLDVPTLFLSEDRFVGIRLGLLGGPTEALDVNGRIKLGYSDALPSEGTMRFDTTTNSFQGFNGSTWTDFGQVRDQDADTRIELRENAIDSIVFTANNADPMSFDGDRLSLGDNGNISLGHQAASMSGYGNAFSTVVGWLAGSDMIEGISNTFIGHSAGQKNRYGDYNTAIGTSSLAKGLLGSRNTLIGYRAGYNCEEDGNIFIGYRAGEFATGANKLYIDNSNTSNPLIHGDFSTNLLTINGDLAISNTTTIDKADINDELNIYAWKGIRFRQGTTNAYNIKYSPTNSAHLQFLDHAQLTMSIYDRSVFIKDFDGAPGIVRANEEGRLTRGHEAHISRFTRFEFNETGGGFTCSVHDKIADGMTITGIRLRSYDDPANQGVQIIFCRQNRLTGAIDWLYDINLNESDLTAQATNTTTTALLIPGANTVDLNNYNYFFLLSALSPMIDVTLLD